MPPATHDHSRQLIVVAGAEEIAYASANDGEVTYTVQEPYPATETLRTISERLRSEGWSAMPEDP
jgi:hypothetical protein